MKIFTIFLLFFLFPLLIFSQDVLLSNKVNTLVNDDFLLIESVEQSWGGDNWVNAIKHSYSYDANNNQTEWLGLNWYGADWVNSSKESYTYDANNNQIEKIFQVYVSNWRNNENYSYLYDVDNNLTEQIYQIWIGNMSIWKNKSKSYTYDVNNNQIEIFFEVWLNAGWVNGERYSYSYDVNNNQTEKITQWWTPNNIWSYSNMYSYSFNVDNNLTEEINQTWDVVNSNWENQGRTIYSYSSINTVENILNSIHTYELSQNYPNPFNPSTTIEFTLPKSEYVELKVYNILGKEVATLVSNKLSQGNHTYQFEGKNLASGIYYYQLLAGEYVDVKKMVLMK